MKYSNLFEECRLCPRNCGVNRSGLSSANKTGFCRLDDRLRVAHIGVHFGEEPPISGTNGSGTIFFSGCSLRCSFCQNYQISRDGLGEDIDTPELLLRVMEMIRRHNVHNVNFVTPDHFFPYAFDLVGKLKDRGYSLPIVYNLSGYQSVRLLAIAEDYADIYLPDYKYSDANISKRLSSCRDYPSVALDAIAEMVRQKGFLDSFEKEKEIASKGVLVRHLILPGEIENSIDALSALYIEFGPDLPISLMSQYYPIFDQSETELNRVVTKDEFDRVYDHVTELGFKNVYVQHPDESSTGSRAEKDFLPDFSLPQPFKGNLPKY